ncbi:hypothetical protein KDH_22100 [Dictyobacter sp. S3.2.2.5]|uniref:NTP pyrophosphohydrolase MazG putative catalytic core domain-containing protein n=1 Tax=Dictyobacter halimunensis TaxID=3026934 RepID=A0ABQ6FM88_9CHLR|nr:hypothetical protein KDH_22100 [Dictyobacter sp. S3.2.2.5]
MHEPDYYEKLILTTDAYNRKFPAGNDPFQIITRLCEESGELASAVNHFEASGVKHQKHGPPDKAALAKEVQDVIRSALTIARYYGVEQELKDAIDYSYQVKLREGFISES